MRAGTARRVVDLLGQAVDPAAACRAALADAALLPDEYRSELRVLALTPDGRHGGAAGSAGATYAVMTEASTEPEIHSRITL
jgi:beta-aspartyl-peptidase (threonine type)